VSTPEQNKAQSQRWFEEVWAKRRAGAIFEMLGPDAVGHTEHGDTVGPGPFARLHAAFLAAFPDLSVVVDEAVAEGDHVAVRWSAAGTHRGEFLGVAATGRQVRFRGMTWHRFEDGRLVEGWDSWNADGLLRELAGG
jgi:steroid delta-isomerase-like uncharacterized protein